MKQLNFASWQAWKTIKQVLVFSRLNCIEMEDQGKQSNTPGIPRENKQPGEIISELKEKYNVDDRAIQEAREAVGDDELKIKEYLINNRGL